MSVVSLSDICTAPFSFWVLHMKNKQKRGFMKNPVKNTKWYSN